MTVEQKKNLLYDYFHKYMELYHKLQLADTDEEVNAIEQEVFHIRKEVKEKFQDDKNRTCSYF